MDGNPNDFTGEELEVLQTANDLRSGQEVEDSGFVGGNQDHLPINSIDFTTLIERFPKIAEFLSNNAQNNSCMAHRWSNARRENHNDVDNNLPDPPYNYDDVNNQDGYYEYHIEKSIVKVSKNLRLVYDSGRNRLYVTPSHYNAWRDNDGTQMNPFMLVRNCPALVCGGRVDFG